MVSPSGGDRTVRPTPSEPPAPVTFSIRTASPSVIFIRSARIRAIASDGPPAENGTMMVMGCDGKFSARALPKASSAVNAARTALRITPSDADAPFAPLLKPGVVDRRVAIERARDRRQRIFKPCRVFEQHHASIFRYASDGETLHICGLSHHL